jgi:hypothetical protein
MTSEEKCNPADGLKTKEVTMQATMIQNAPMVQIRPRLARRPDVDIDAILQQTKVDFPEWTALFDDAHLHVQGSVRLEDVIELCKTAPSELLSGYVIGLFVNN